MNIFNKAFEGLHFFKELKKAVDSGLSPVSLSGVSHIHKCHAALGLSQDRRVFVLCDEEATARRIVSDINSLSNESTAALFPAKEFSFSHIESISKEYEHQRIEALSRLVSGECSVIAASVEAALQATIPQEKLKELTFSVSSGDEINVQALSSKLIEMGYAKYSQVEGMAQFSVRGSIIDIFPVSSSIPLRIELWGDEVDTVYTFDPQTQRRIDVIDNAVITPANEVGGLHPDELKEKIRGIMSKARGKKADVIKTALQRDIELIESGITLNNMDKYYKLCYPEGACITDYFTGDDVVLVFENTNCKERAKGFLSQLSEDIKIFYEEGILFKELGGFYFELPELMSKCDSIGSAYLDTFLRNSDDLRFKKLISANAMQTAGWSGDLKQLIEDLEVFTERKYCTVVMAGSDKTGDILVKDLRESGFACELLTDSSEILPSMVYIRPGAVSGGYEYPDTGLALITQSKALNSKKRKAKQKHKGEEIKSLSDISSGDLVVHSLYGIGKFSGITKLENGGVSRDYIKINYAGSDVLYVPVTQLDLVSRYIGPREDAGVKLNKLGSDQWQKTRSRVKGAVRDMAEELIKLYAKRQSSKGYAFSPDNDWQAEFEERFDYMETDDQLRSIQEIKEDMQKPIPMDRLLCGDVGFGKTEVALRAAMKCILDSKQCAILVPTTVLAWQHYQTAIRRFEHFPIRIELLSRFRTAKQQQEIVRAVNRGEIDLVIGTHRLVQNDVKFKSLGLAIIDEEQRFGVAHKEKFKEMFSGVDVLTLSATPIPRTLNMAMSGIRDMSVIEEPPQDRHPIQTYVIEHNDGVILQAISKELRRGGQVYYIHNRIETIERCVAKIQSMLPDARIGVAHGQIGENELSEIWRQLIDREIDILVCTTLIETGVDVPNVNTLIIEDADRLGLSQLYQLRGRVGRSTKRAFAYFTFRRGKVLTEIAQKRLNAIREFTQFGSGFRIAMRDLEIRGAGSILSGKQHGHMEAVGYDMYIRLLSEAIAEQKGEALPHSPEDCLVDVAIDAYIPESYVESLSQRIECYRKIACIQNKEDSMDVLDELIDRYGEPPKSVVGLVNVALLRNTASQLGITEITQRDDCLLFFIKIMSSEQITALNTTYKNRILFVGTGKSYFKIKLAPKQKAPALMQEVIELMHNA